MKRLATIITATALLVGIGKAQEPADREIPPGKASEGSIYDLDSTWRSQEGTALKLADLEGKVRVVAMGYTSCQFACPRIIADLKRIDSGLSEEEKKSGRIQISFISIDPETDTPERMKKLEKDYAVDPKRWLLLTGDEDGVLELAVALGMKYRQTSAIDFAHSNIITVLAADGQIAYQTSKIGEDLSKVFEAIRRELTRIPD